MEEKPKDFPVLEWFEDEEFLAQVIQLGIGRMTELGATNFRGMIHYLLDKQHKSDAEKIAKLVKEYNKPLWAYGNRMALESIVGESVEQPVKKEVPKNLDEKIIEELVKLQEKNNVRK